MSGAKRETLLPLCGRRWRDEVGPDEGLSAWQALRLLDAPRFEGIFRLTWLRGPHPTFAHAKATFSRGAGEGIRASAEPMTPSLETRGHHHPLWRSCRGRRRLLRLSSGRTHRDRRPERRGQDDLFQSDVRAIARYQRRVLLNGADVTRHSAPQRARAGIGRAFPAHQSFSRSQRHRKCASRRAGGSRRPL